MIKIFCSFGLLILMSQIVFTQQVHRPFEEDSIPPLSISLPPEIDRVLRDYEQGWRNFDAETLAALFTPDGFILRPGHPPVRGRSAIAEAYRNSGGALYLRAMSFAQADSAGYIIGAYSHVQFGADAGKFILTLRLMSDKKWYITADMDNSNH